MRDSRPHVAMGADAICFFQWRQSKSGAEAFHSAMLPYAGADSKVFRGVYELGKALKTLSDAGLQGTELESVPARRSCSARKPNGPHAPETPASMKPNHWHDVRPVPRLRMPGCARTVPLAYDWTGYKTIVLPTVLSLSDEDVLRIADFAKAGGTVIVGHAAGLIDEHFHIGLGGYPRCRQRAPTRHARHPPEEFNILGEEAEGEPSEISLSNGLTTRLWQNDVTSIAATPQCLPLTQVSPPPTGSWSAPPSPAAPMATVPPSTWAATSTVTTLPSCSKHLAPMAGVVGAAD